MPLKRNKLKQKAKLVVDLSALPHRHYSNAFFSSVRTSGRASAAV